MLWHFTDHELKNWLITVPLLLLALNLMTSLLTNKIFRTQGWLLLFHAALLCLLLLLGISQLTKLIGAVEVTRGSLYDQSSAQWQQGVLHSNRLDQLQFKLEDFNINYAVVQGVVVRQDTQAYIAWVDEDGQIKQGVVGDKVPLEIYGYKLYTTHNKGFASMFRWIPKQGVPIEGSVHFPAWPEHEFNQVNELQIPNTPYKIWLNLKFFDPIFSTTGPSVFRIPNDFTLVTRVDEQRYELKPGDHIEFETGSLEFLGLTTWMGFQIFYDWSLPWILAFALLAIVGLTGHFWKKFAPEPWSAGEIKPSNQSDSLEK